MQVRYLSEHASGSHVGFRHMSGSSLRGREAFCMIGRAPHRPPADQASGSQVWLAFPFGNHGVRCR